MWRRDDDSKKVFDRLLPLLGYSLGPSLDPSRWSVARSGEMECVCHPRASERLRDVQGSAKRVRQGFVNAAGKLRQKW